MRALKLERQVPRLGFGVYDSPFDIALHIDRTAPAPVFLARMALLKALDEVMLPAWLIEVEGALDVSV